MKKFALLIATAAVLAAAPVLVQPASAQSIRIGVGNDRNHHDGYRSHASGRVVVVGNRNRCRTVTTRIHRGGKVIIKRERRCGRWD